MPVAKKTAHVPVLTEESVIACDIPLVDNTYVITIEGNLSYNNHAVWCIPGGVQSLTSKKITLELANCNLTQALNYVANKAKEEMKDLPTGYSPDDTSGETKMVASTVLDGDEDTSEDEEAPAKAPVAKKAAAKKAPAAKKAAPVKKAPAKRPAVRKVTK